MAWQQASAGPGTTLTRPATLNLNQQEPAFLTADDAFRLSALRANDQLKLTWQIAEGYYLYQHRFQVKPRQAGDAALPGLEFPAGISRKDDYFGEITAYYDQVELSIAVEPLDDGPGAREILVIYQGCADAGLCYPPQKRTLQLVKDGHVTVHKTAPE